MNLQPGKINGTIRGPVKRQRSESFACYSGFVVKFVCLVFAFMSVLVAHLYLRQQCVKSAERTDDIKKQIMDVKAENRNLRNDVAKLTGWPHVSKKIRQFKLALGPAEFGQRIKIVVYSPEQAAKIPLTPIKVASAVTRSAYSGR